MLSPSSASWPLLLLLCSDLLCANSPIPAEASLWACDSGVPGVLPRVLCKARDFVSPEDSRERLGGEFAAALDLHHRTVSSQTICSSTSALMFLTWIPAQVARTNAKCTVAGSMQ